MGLFDKIFGKKPGGKIGFYKLTDWWEETFSDSEKRLIAERFQPMDEVSLTTGDVESSGSAVGFLCGLASWFEKPQYRTVAYRILAKAEELARTTPEILDIHFLYQSKIEIYYRNRNDDPHALNIAMDACQQQIDIGESALRALKREYGDAPEHKGYTQLAIILEKQGKYDQAIELCDRAASQGWAGDWEKRIARCRKRAARADLSNHEDGVRLE